MLKQKTWLRSARNLTKNTIILLDWKHVLGSRAIGQKGFFGPINGNYFRTAVDAFLKWLELYPTKQDYTVYQKLAHLFITFGLPLVITYFLQRNTVTSSNFKHYLYNIGICQRTCAPFHLTPQVTVRLKGESKPLRPTLIYD